MMPAVTASFAAGARWCAFAAAYDVRSLAARSPMPMALDPEPFAGNDAARRELRLPVRSPVALPPRATR
jgi:hypothetical protein